MKPKGIILADPHPQVRSALRLLLEQDSGFLIAGEAGNAEEAITSVRIKLPGADPPRLGPAGCQPREPDRHAARLVP